MDENILTQVLAQNAELVDAIKGMATDKGLHTKAPATYHTAIRLHGEGGLFANCGVERDVLSAHVRPKGIAGVLPLLPTTDERPRFATITGFTDTYGTQPDNVCDDAPYNYMKSCEITAQFGTKRFDTKTIDYDEVMLRINRGDFTDLVLQAELLGMPSDGLYPGNISQADILNIVTVAEMVGVGVSFERAISQDIWQGLVSAGTFPGLDVQIATGVVDMSTNTTCPSMDSDVKNFAYSDVCGTDLDIVEYLSMLMYYLEELAEDTSMAPVTWVLAMRPQLFWELTSCWPCRYMSNRCTDIAGTQLVVMNDESATRMRDDLRRRQVLPVNGVEYNVVLDTGIAEATPTTDANLEPGEFASSIYAVPLRVRGNFPVTYRQYLDFRRGAADVQMTNGEARFFWTDNGLFSWAYEDIKWCYKMAAKTTQRVVLRTPYLAGRIDDIKYTPLQHLRSAYPESPYWDDGGVSARSAGTFYANWLGR